MNRGPRPHRALADAIPIAKTRGMIQMAKGGPERIFDIVVFSKLPVTFVTIMFAPRIIAPVSELVEYYKDDIERLRLIARDSAIAIELWIRSRHGTWRFFQVTPSTIVEIDREGRRIETGGTVAYLAGIAAHERQASPTP